MKARRYLCDEDELVQLVQHLQDGVADLSQAVGGDGQHGRTLCSTQTA